MKIYNIEKNSKTNFFKGIKIHDFPKKAQL